MLNLAVIYLNVLILPMNMIIIYIGPYIMSFPRGKIKLSWEVT